MGVGVVRVGQAGCRACVGQGLFWGTNKQVTGAWEAGALGVLQRKVSLASGDDGSIPSDSLVHSIFGSSDGSVHRNHCFPSSPASSPTNSHPSPSCDSEGSAQLWEYGGSACQ